MLFNPQDQLLHPYHPPDQQVSPHIEQKLLGCRATCHIPRIDTLSLSSFQMGNTNHSSGPASSCSYSLVFDNIIAQNPQDEIHDPPTNTLKVQLSYAQAAANLPPVKKTKMVTDLTDG